MTSKKLKVYFSASTRDFNTWKPFYLRIIKTIKMHNATITRDWITCTEESLRKGIHEFSNKGWEAIYRAVIKAIKAANIMIVENSNPSFSNGYLTYFALTLNKPTLILQKLATRKSFMRGLTAGIKHPLLTKFFYSYESQALEQIGKFIKQSKETIARKSFHLKLSVKEYNKLTKLMLKTGKSRTQIIRDLILKTKA